VSEGNVTAILARLESLWFDVAGKAIADIVQCNPDDIVYAAAFHLFYADGTQILAPALAANTEAHFASAARGGSDAPPHVSLRWRPPEWRWDVVDEAVEPLRDLYGQLSGILRNLSDEDAAELYAAHDRVMCGVARRLTVQARARHGAFSRVEVVPYFVVLVLEIQRGEEEYAALLRASVEPGMRNELRDMLDPERG
jgi:hypothetical protein